MKLETTIHEAKKRNKKWIDGLKWLLVLLLCTVAVVGNYQFRSLPVPTRATGICALLLLAALCALWTRQGGDLIVFFRQAYAELKRVIWPTRKETLQMTLFVVGLSALMALFLWGLDSCLVRIVAWITGWN